MPTESENALAPRALVRELRISIHVNQLGMSRPKATYGQLVKTF